MDTNIEDLRHELVPTEGPPRQALQVGAQVEMERALAQVQAAMTVAKRFPRNPQEALARILRQCAIEQVAEDAEYVYRRGKATVRGPTIRLLEVLQREWGNIESGTVELARYDGESIAMTYAWDLETNSKSVKQFVVPHRRDKDEGSVELSSDRDIYEMVANMGARRKRACLEEIIPYHIKDAAIAACRTTLDTKSRKRPLAERIKILVENFATINVTEVMLAKWLKRPVTEMMENEYQDLRAIGRAIKDNVGRVDEYFETATTVAEQMATKRAGKASAAGPVAAGEKKPAATPAPAATPDAVVAGQPAGPEKVAEPTPQALPLGPDAGQPATEAAGADQPAPVGGTADAEEDDGPLTKADLIKLIDQTTNVDGLNEMQGMIRDAGLPEAEVKELKKHAANRAKQLIQKAQSAKAPPPAQAQGPE